MSLTVLSVAYPLAPVTSAGVGAEQILAQIDEGLEARGHRSLVVAQEGSQVCGRLIGVPGAPDVLSHAEYTKAERRHLAVIERVVAREQWTWSTSMASTSTRTCRGTPGSLPSSPYTSHARGISRRRAICGFLACASCACLDRRHAAGLVTTST